MLDDKTSLFLLASIFRFKGDVKLAPSDRIIIEKNENLYTLTLKQVVRKDAAQYTVKATNNIGTANASATLKVKGIMEFCLCITPILLLISDFQAHYLAFCSY